MSSQAEDEQIMRRNVRKAYRECIQHIDNATRFTSPEFEYNPNGFGRWYYSRTLPKAIQFDDGTSTVTAAPVIFEVVGQISKAEPITKDEDPCALFFCIESRPDPASRGHWQRIPEALKNIASGTGHNPDISKVFRKDPCTGRGFLRVNWNPAQRASLFSQVSPKHSQGFTDISADHSLCLVSKLDCTDGEAPVFIRGYKGQIESLRAPLPIQVLFHLSHNDREDLDQPPVLELSLISVASL